MTELGQIATLKLRLDASKIVVGSKVSSKAINNITLSAKGAAVAVDRLVDKEKKLKKATGSLDNSVIGLGRTIKRVITGLGTTLAIVAIGKVFSDSIRLLANFEQALVGVGKTTGIAGSNLQNLGDKVIKLTKVLPISSVELLKITQAAGQLGVRGNKALLKFTDTIARLGIATNLSGAEAATTLARILSVTNEAPETVDKLADVIVNLGNNFAATEREIALVTTRVAQAGAAFGISSTEAAALSTVFASLGVHAELAGSTMTRSFSEIRKTIDENGTSLKLLSDILGISGAEIGETFAKSPVKGFQLFTTALNKAVKAGIPVSSFLDIFNLKGIRLEATLGTISTRVDEFGRAMDDAIKSQDALLKESSEGINTLIGDWGKLKGAISSVVLSYKDGILPVLRDMVQITTALVKSEGPLEKFITSLIPTVAFNRSLDAILEAINPEIVPFSDTKKDIREKSQLQFIQNQIKNRKNQVAAFPQGVVGGFDVKPPDFVIVAAKAEAEITKDLIIQNKLLTVRNSLELKRLRIIDPEGFRTKKEREKFDASLKRAGIFDAEGVDPLKEEFDRLQKLEEQLKKFSPFADDISNSFGTMFGDMISGAESASEAWDNLGRSIANAVLQQTITKPISETISSAITGFIGDGFEGAAAGFVAGLTKKGSGGPVNAGESFLVGERGEPEIFTPTQSGVITPMSKLGQASPIFTVNITNNNVNQNTVTASEPTFNGREYILNIVVDGVNRNVNGLRDTIKANV